LVFRSDIELKKKLSKLLTLLRSNPKNDLLHYKAGKLSLDSKEYDKALSHFYTAFEQKPKEPRYLLAIGKTPAWVVGTLIAVPTAIGIGTTYGIIKKRKKKR